MLPIKLWLPFISHPQFLQPLRTTFVVKRVNPAPLPSSRRVPSLRRKHFVYETIEDNQERPETLSVLLQKYVEDVGKPGDIVNIKAKAARLLLLTKAAVYNTEENVAAAGGANKEASFSSLYAGTTIKLLSNFVLNISMNRDEPWTLEHWHIRSAFRKAHVHVPDHAFTMPKDPIIGPDMELEGKEFYITVSINKTEQVPVRCRIHHWSTKKEKRIPPVRDHWKFPAEIIFPEDKAIANTLPEIIPPVLVEDEGPPHLRSNKPSSAKKFIKRKR